MFPMIILLALSYLIKVTEHQDVWDQRPVSAHPWYPTGSHDSEASNNQFGQPEIISYPATKRRRPIFRQFRPSTTTTTTTTTTSTTIASTTTTTVNFTNFHVEFFLLVLHFTVDNRTNDNHDSSRTNDND